MQTANIMLALAGDAGNTISKYGVTAAEIAVLRVIHGDDSVFDVEPAEPVDRKDREERQRLLEKYGHQQEGRFVSPAVDALFPGAAARVFHDLDELDLPEELYKAEKRTTAKTKPALKPQAEPKGEEGKSLDDMTKAELVGLASAKGVEVDAKAKKPEIIAAIRAAETAPSAAGEDTDDDAEDDGIGEMNDQNSIYG